MTEAQKCLYHIAENMRMDKSISKEGYEYFQQAIKALEQEPCEDAISREWLKTAIHNFYYGLKHTPTEEDIQAYIDVAPSVKPQEPTRHWIGDKAYPICPKCNCNIIEEYISCSDYAEMYKSMKYCPNCGAKMD